MKEAPFRKEHSLGMLALRIFLGVLDLAITVWLVVGLVPSAGVYVQTTFFACLMLTLPLFEHVAAAPSTVTAI